MEKNRVYHGQRRAAHTGFPLAPLCRRFPLRHVRNGFQSLRPRSGHRTENRRWLDEAGSDLPFRRRVDLLVYPVDPQRGKEGADQPEGGGTGSGGPPSPEPKDSPRGTLLFIEATPCGKTVFQSDPPLGSNSKKEPSSRYVKAPSAEGPSLYIAYSNHSQPSLGTTFFRRGLKNAPPSADGSPPAGVCHGAHRRRMLGIVRHGRATSVSKLRFRSRVDGDRSPDPLGFPAVDRNLAVAKGHGNSRDLEGPPRSATPPPLRSGGHAVRPIYLFRRHRRRQRSYGHPFAVLGAGTDYRLLGAFRAAMAEGQGDRLRSVGPDGHLFVSHGGAYGQPVHFGSRPPLGIGLRRRFSLLHAVSLR